MSPLPALEAPHGAAARDAFGSARAWHGAWALAFAAVAGLDLLLAREAPATGMLAAFLFAIAPGAAGALGLAAETALLAGLWGAAASIAVMLSGGVAGPLAPVLAGPALAVAVLGGGRRDALAAAVLTVGAAALLGALASRPQAVDAAPGLRAAVLLATGACAALALARRRAIAPAVAAPAPGTETGTGTTALREELAQAQAARAAAEETAEGRARFLAQMSHELRTPLNAILGFSDIMRTRLFGPIPDRYGEYAELIHESGRHLTELINDVLDLSKIEADRYELRREVFDGRDAVTDAMRLVRVQAEEKGVALRALLPSAAVEIDADHRAIKQMVLNLVANAIKFTPPGGSVDVTLREAAGALEIAVADTGVGIAPEDLKRLGQPYAQAQAGRDAPQGTGLGLSLVKAFAALHGGELMLESRLGEGACATVRLPVLVGEETRPLPPLAALEPTSPVNGEGT